MKSIIKYSLFLICCIFVSNDIKGGTYWAAPGEVAPNPTGAGTVYINNPTKPTKSAREASTLKYVKIANPGGAKKWAESPQTSSQPGNNAITMGCTPNANWFFIGWTKDARWTSDSQFVSTIQETTIEKVLTFYNTGRSSSNDGGMVDWINDNMDKCTFFFANFARVKATTDNQNAFTSCVPIVNNDGDEVTLSASPNTESGDQFSHWEVNGATISNDNPLTFTISSENYGEYKAVYSSISYPDDGTYVLKNTGTGKYASFGGNIHLPNAKRTKDYCRQFSIQINDDGEITSLTSDGNDAYDYRSALVTFSNNVLGTLGIESSEVSTFINSATTIYVEPSLGGYRAYHKIPALSSTTSSATTWTEIKDAIISALPASSFSLPEQRFISKVVSSIVPGGKYYLSASEDGEEIVYSQDGTTDYSIWNTENPPTDYPYLTTTNYTWSHLKNVGTGGMASFIGNDFKASTDVDFSGIVALKDYSSGTSDPGAVLFIRNSSQQSDFYSQGYSISNNQDWLRINANENLSVKITPAWYESAVLSTTDGESIIGNGTYGDWVMEPISSSSMDRYYFGAKCSAKYTDGEGHYYTTMYTYFPYQCMDGVKAYYLPASGVDLENKRITCQEISSGKVPANTAVILECEGLSPIENRLIPISSTYDWNTNTFSCSDSSVGSITDNVLMGVYFNLKNDKHENRTAYKPERYLVFSIANGLLGFYKHNSMQYLSAGKAYLDLNKLESAGVKDLTGYRLSFERNEETTNIDGMPAPSNSEKTPMDGVYNLMGVKMAEKFDSSNLPQGLYIVNGKKYIVR